MRIFCKSYRNDENDDCKIKISPHTNSIRPASSPASHIHRSDRSTSSLQRPHPRHFLAQQRSVRTRGLVLRGLSACSCRTGRPSIMMRKDGAIPAHGRQNVASRPNHSARCHATSPALLPNTCAQVDCARLPCLGFSVQTLLE